MRCKVTMFNVGQGVMNLIEIYDRISAYGPEKLVNLSLVDCGGDLSQKRGEACRYVQSKMQQRYQSGGDKIPKLYLDNLFISHRDKDHFNLFFSIFELLDMSGGTSAVNSMIIADRPIPSENMQQYFITDVHANNYTQRLSYSSDTYEIKMLSHYTSNNSNIVRISCTMQSGKISLTWDPVETMVFKDEQPIAFHYFLSNENRLVLLYFSPNAKNAKDCEIMEYPNTYEQWMNFVDFLRENDFSERGIDSHISNAICNVMQKHRSKDDIADIMKPQPTSSGTWIGATYIGGNKNHETQEYKILKDWLSRHCNSHNNVEQGKVLKLYGEYEVTVLERLVIASSSANSVANNSTSLVLVLSKKDDSSFQKVVFPGDANCHTFRRMLERSKNQYTGNDYLQSFQRADWLAPHHGSHSFQENRANYDETSFYHIITDSSAQKMCIPAGKENTYGHPHNSFVQTMLSYYIGAREDSHLIIYNENDTKSAQWTTEETTAPLYTHITEIPKEYRIGQRTLYSPSIQINCCSQEEHDDKFRVPATKREYFGTPAPELFFYRK